MTSFAFAARSQPMRLIFKAARLTTFCDTYTKTGTLAGGSGGTVVSII